MLAALFITHYVADFLLQPREMGKKKSYELKWLVGHLLIQFLCFWPVAGWKFAALNCLLHGVIDWNIWRAYKAFVFMRLKNYPNHSLHSFGEWKYYEDHWFYATIGLDQLLHALTIYYLYVWLLQ